MSRRSRKRLVWVLMLLPLTGLAIPLLRKAKGKEWEQVIRQSEYRNYLPWIVAQAKHETGNYTSNLYKNHNSLFGMKVPSKRPFDGRPGPTAPDGGVYASYDSLAQSARDYLNLLRYNRFPTNLSSVKGFVQALKDDRYFTDSLDNYYNGMMRFL